MRFIRGRMMLAGSLLAVAATSGVVLAGPASAASSQVVLVNCHGAGQVRPAGYDINYPILVVLWRAQPWPGHAGQHYFSRLTWIFTGQRPAHTPTSQTFALPSSAQP